ncbi:Glutamyl-tRNA amidotransferase subunit A, mitochondrial [Mycena belliarum]|uniref:Glutamyl-tRNA(Gln) amidotransferase subunit A, mitochondrial n=1 Tax=Mycena belliarum TaxID=1033014 RepID=A0AAD6U7G7_9AGAR|nr:Glutamyl-tRNA amidotransferase subunit A, mitochondrial [Mycena belliae]
MRINVARRLTHRLSSWRPVNDASVNAFVCIAPPTPSAPDPGLPLNGVSVGLKDMICTTDMPTTSASGMLRDFTSPFDATVVTLLRAAGAHIAGKLNCDEFGMGSLNVHSIHGAVVNPFQAPSVAASVPWTEREKRSAGGSSGGSAAAVAAGLCDAALSTDTGGSTRLPAAYCGVVGLKPSYGLISRHGIVAFADSLDCVGIMAPTIARTKRIFDILNRHDPADPTSASHDSRAAASARAFDSWSSGVPSSLRIGVPAEYFPSELPPRIMSRVRAALARLKELGATLVPVSLPATPYALSAYYVLASAEASSNMARYSGVHYGMHVPAPAGEPPSMTAAAYARTRSVGLGSEVKKRILLGTYSLTADAFDNYFLQAQRVRRLVSEDFARVFRASAHSRDNRDAGMGGEGVDVLIHPSAMRVAPRLGEVDGSDGLDAYVQDVLTVPASLAGLPALSVPLPASGAEGSGDEDECVWPVGASVVGPWGAEEAVLAVGEMLEGLSR